MFKKILAIVLGVVVAVGTTTLTDALFHSMVAATPMPRGGDAAAMRAWMAAQPPSAFAAVLAGWILSAFSGAAVAARAAGRIAWPGWVVTGLYSLAVLANFVMLPHPLAMVAAGALLVPAAGWLGARLASSGASRADGFRAAQTD